MRGGRVRRHKLLIGSVALLMTMAMAATPSAISLDAHSAAAAESAVPLCDDALLQAIPGFYIQTLHKVGYPFDINDSGVVVGAYGRSGAMYADYTYSTFDVPDTTSTRIWSISNDGVLGGDFASTTWPYYQEGFRQDVTGLATFDVPNSEDTIATDVGADGTVVGIFFPESVLDLPAKGFIKTPGSLGYVTVAYPDAVITAIESVNGSGTVAGNYIPADGKTYGFTYAAGSGYASFAVSGAVKTIPLRIDDDGTIFGRYEVSDGTERLFTKGAAFATANLPLPGSHVTGQNSSGWVIGTYRCHPFEGNPNPPRVFGFVARPAITPSIELVSKAPIDLSKTGKIRIALLSSDEFDAPASAGTTVLLPRETFWAENDLRGGTPPLSFKSKDVNGDGLDDVVFKFPRQPIADAWKPNGLVLTGTTPEGMLFVGIESFEFVTTK